VPEVYDEVRSRMTPHPPSSTASGFPSGSLGSSSSSRPGSTAASNPVGNPVGNPAGGTPARSTSGNTAPLRRPRVGTVRVCQPADGVAEAAAVVHGPQRTRAIALRLEGLDGRWRVTVFQAG
jgi:hypothetical protein